MPLLCYHQPVVVYYTVSSLPEATDNFPAWLPCDKDLDDEDVGMLVRAPLQPMILNIISSR